MGASVLRSLHALQQAEQELRQHQTALAAARKALQDISAAAQEHARSGNPYRARYWQCSSAFSCSHEQLGKKLLVLHLVLSTARTTGMSSCTISNSKIA